MTWSAITVDAIARARVLLEDFEVTTFEDGDDADLRDGGPDEFAIITLPGGPTEVDEIGAVQLVEDGVLLIMLFHRPGDAGRTRSDQIAEALREGLSNSQAGVVEFKTPTRIRLGIERGWWRVNIEAPYSARFAQ